MIHFSDVHKSYLYSGGVKHVLRGITMKLEPGKNTAFIGQNGAGKSTLFRLLSGAEIPDSGVIKRDATVSWPLGFRGGLHGALTGRENIAFIARIYEQDFDEMLDFVEEFADIGKNMGQRVSSYSSGMKARVAFGMSMAVNFDYYLIDEVIAVGDAAFKRKCKKILEDRLETSTVILISHSNTLMREFCEHGAVLQDGKLFNFSSLNEAIEFYNIENSL